MLNEGGLTVDAAMAEDGIANLGSKDEIEGHRRRVSTCRGRGVSTCGGRGVSTRGEEVAPSTCREEVAPSTCREEVAPSTCRGNSGAGTSCKQGGWRKRTGGRVRRRPVGRNTDPDK